MNKKIIVIIGVIGVIIIGIIIITSVFNGNNDSSQLITDRDTGKTVSLAEDTSVSAGAAGEQFNSSTNIIGLESITESLIDLGGNFSNYLQIAFVAFSQDRLKDAYSTITIRPQVTKVEGLHITTALRLGQGDEILPVTIDVSRNNHNSLILRISDPKSKYGGDYVYIGGMATTDNLLYSIYYIKDYKKPTDPIIITIDAPESYREAALDYIRELGYSPAEFTINFSNYENPFK